jgi:peptide/nickel transport system substrate-binding protein
MTKSLYSERGRANERDVGYWCTWATHELGMLVQSDDWRPPWGAGIAVAWSWRQWYDTDGKGGEEPPAEIKRLFQAIEEWRTAVPGSEDYKRLAKEVIDTNVRNLYHIGTVSMAPWPFIVKNTLGNVMETGYWAGFPYRHFLPIQPEQWYFKE